LAKSTARLLVAEHVAQRGDLARQVGEALLGVIDHRDALVQALQPLHRLPRHFVHGMTEPHRDRVEPLRHHAGKLGLATAQHFAQSLEAADGLGLDAGEFRHAALHGLALPHLP